MSCEKLKFAIACLLALLLAACGEQKPGADGGDSASGQKSTVVARLGDLEITAAEVDDRVLALPMAQRPGPGDDLDSWYVEQIGLIAVEHRLRQEAIEAKLDEGEAWLETRRAAEKQIGFQLCLAELRPESPRITEEDLRAYFEAHEDEFAAPERRAVYNLFLRRRPGVGEAEARARIEELRDQVLGGERFLRVASAHSDSESRHREGLLGWMVPGQLPAGFDEAVFSLEEGVPSEPVSTRQGLHLFYVDQILPARQLTFEEARPKVHERLDAERRAAVMAEVERVAAAQVDGDVHGRDGDQGAVVLGREAFKAVLEAGDPEAVVLRLGEVELTLGGLRHQVRQSMSRSQQTATPPREQAWQILERIRQRELIYRHCLADELIPADRLEERLESWRQSALVDLQRRRRLLEVAKQDRERLRLFYDNNIGLFSKAPTWTLRSLRLPLGEAAVATMARLEEAASRSRAGDRSVDLEALQGELGGEIEDLGAKTLVEWGVYQPKLPTLVAPLEVGELSAPFRPSEEHLEIVEVSGRGDGEPIPFESTLDRVASAYVGQYSREVYDRLTSEVLAGVELEIDPEGLAALRASGQGDVSVEELDELLEGLESDE